MWLASRNEFVEAWAQTPKKVADACELGKLSAFEMMRIIRCCLPCLTLRVLERVSVWSLSTSPVFLRQVFASKADSLCLVGCSIIMFSLGKLRKGFGGTDGGEGERS